MTKKRTNPGGLPYGSGSLQKRGLMWWAIYCNADGVKIQESSKTSDLEEARRFLAARVLETLEARAARLREVIDGTEKKTAAKPARGRAGKKPADHDDRHATGGGSVRKDLAIRAQRDAATGGKGAQPMKGKIVGAAPGPEADRAAADLVGFLLGLAERRKKRKAEAKRKGGKA